jgi:hypothetical protein
LEERFLHQGDIEWSTTVFGTFAWPVGSTLEDFGISEILKLPQHFNMEDGCKQVLCNECCEFRVLGTGKKLKGFLI